jgi:Na+/proline symporter
MHYLSIDYLIVYAFLLITLVIGLRSGRGIKSVREYIVANKSFGTMALVLTYLATNIAGASVFNVTGVIFNDGVIITAALLMLMLTFLFRALFIAPHAVKFPTCLTMGDLVGTLYGPTSKIMAGFLGLFTTFCIATMELSMLGEVGQSLLGWPNQGTIVLGGILLALYTAHGGIKSVTTTDVFQFLVLLIGIPILAIVTIEEAGGMKAIFAQVPQERLQVWNHPQFTHYLTLALVWLIPLGMVDPCEIQRMLMGKSRKQLRNQFLIISVFDPSLQLTLMLIGLAGLVLYPHIEGLQLIPHIVHHLLPEGLRGLIMAGLFGVVTSTIDSYLHAMGVTAVHDILQPALGYRFKETVEIRYTQYATVLLSLGAIYAALHTQNFLGLLVLSLELAGPLLMVPIIAGMMGLKPDSKVFYGATVVTLVAYLIAKLKLPAEQGHFVALVSVLANGVSFFGFHGLRHKGFVTVQSTQSTTYLYQPPRKTFLERLRDSIPTPQRIVAYSQKQVKQYGAPYILLGVFCCINYTFPYFMWKHEATAMYTTMLYLRVLGAVLCGLLIVKDKWPQSLLPYLPTFWHLTLLYCLPFTSTVMFLLTQGSVEWLINVALTIMFLIVLVDWMSFIMLTVLGVALGCFFYTLAIGPIDLQLDFSTGYLLVYQGIFATLIGLLFARRKQLHFDTLTAQRERSEIDNQATREDLLEATEEKFRFVNMLKKAGVEQLESVAHLSKRLLELSKKKGSAKEMTTLAQQLTDQLTPMALSMDRFVHRATGFLLLDGVETVPLDGFLHTLQQALYAKGSELRVDVRTQHKTLQCDAAKMKKVILNSFAFLHSVAGEAAKESLLLAIEDTHLGYAVDSVSPDHIKKVRALRFVITTTPTLPNLSALYMSQIGEESIMSLVGPTQMPLIANERIVKAHYGYSTIVSERDRLSLVYVIPIEVREVRSKEMDTPQMQLGASWPRADDTYPGAQEQEKAFLKAVRERSKADLSVIEKALNVIKDYHGPTMRESGEPFYLHPVAVCQIVLDYNQEEATLLGALLHDTVEDTPLTLEQVALLFNEEVRAIVQGVTHMESHKNTHYKVLLSHPEDIHRLLELEDPRVLYVKLADRMHNMRTLEAKSHESRRRIAEETLFFFVPLAKYLKLSAAAEELKHRSFKVLEST